MSLLGACTISLLGRNPFCTVYFVQINVRCVVLVKDIKKGLLGFQGRGIAAQIPCGVDKDAEVLLLAVEGYPYSWYSLFLRPLDFSWGVTDLHGVMYWSTHGKYIFNLGLGFVTLKAMLRHVFTQSSATETDWPLQQSCCETCIFFLFTWKWSLLIRESWWHFKGHAVVCRSHRGADGTHASSRASLTEAGKESLCLMRNLITCFLCCTLCRNTLWLFFDSLSNHSQTLGKAVL